MNNALSNQRLREQILAEVRTMISKTDQQKPDPTLSIQISELKNDIAELAAVQKVLLMQISTLSKELEEQKKSFRVQTKTDKPSSLTTSTVTQSSPAPVVAPIVPAPKPAVIQSNPLTDTSAHSLISSSFDLSN